MFSQDLLSNGRDLPWMKRALTDRSYKKFVNCNVPDNSMTNSDLATYGDALLKFALCSILLDRPGHMSVSKSHYESDKTLVTVIGKRYRIMDHLLYDRDDRNIASDYNWSPGSGNEDRRHKHIATAVEAVLGAIYKEHGDMDEIISIAEHWVSVVDEEDRITDAIRQRRSQDHATRKNTADVRTAPRAVPPAICMGVCFPSTYLHHMATGYTDSDRSPTGPKVQVNATAAHIMPMA